LIMHILVASALVASSQMASAINTVKMAQGFARLGHTVTIICRQPWAGQVPADRLAKAYGLTEKLDWIQVPGSILVDRNWIFSLLAWRVARHIQPDLAFTRSYIFPWLSSRFGVTTAAESHAHPDNRTLPFLLMVRATRHRSFRLWVTISQHLADHYHSLGVPREKLAILADAVDLRLFQRPFRLPPNPFPDDGPNVVYAGHLYDYKGIPTVLESAKRLPNVQIHLVGGWPKDIARQERKARQLGIENVSFHGLKPQSDVPPFLWHADVLLLPPSQHHPSAAWTSPLKLGEYLASGTPVVASDIPALRDWVTDDEVEFVLPDDAKDLACGIQRVLDDRRRAEHLSAKGLQRAQSMSYRHRAKIILQRCGFSTE
jgi:glycosyltransferase involved in cell wall biosynthesis